MTVAGMKFDPTFNLGHVLTIVALLVGGAVGYGQLSQRIDTIEGKIVDLPDIRALVQQQQVQIAALAKTDDLTRESLRRLFDRLDQIGKDVATIKGQLALQAGQP
jgi:hypothetical protein